MKKITDWFDRVYVINCQHRPDRKEKVQHELESKGVADMDKIIFYKAIVGDMTLCPDDWRSGRGAWGCLRSHQRIMEDVMHDVDDNRQIIPKSILILEDDVFFVDDALTKLNDFMKVVPDDWGQIYLGGQHRAKRLETKDEEVYIGLSVNRTHAYAVNTQIVNEASGGVGQIPIIQKIYKHISYASDYRGTKKHIDHQLELAHRRMDWRVYCPKEWICGQEAGSSNISGKKNERKIW